MSGTKRVRVDPDDPHSGAIDEAAALLRAGSLVAFATETVYGLGADATSDAAVTSIFTAKGRPSNNPLIAHVCDVAMARACAEEWTPAAQALAEALWPGPLTLVVSRGDITSDAVSAGLDSVGLRLPRTEVARALIEAAGVPIAAPSANRSEHVSPTSAQHVLDDLDGRIAMVLDSGPTRVGIESTVVDVRGARPCVLRLGPIEPATIGAVVGTAPVLASGAVPDDAPRRSPGRSHRHYAPDVPAVRCEGALPELREGDVVLAFGAPVSAWVPVHHFEDPQSAAAALYDTMRALERSGATRIVVRMPPGVAGWAAIRDRLRRATTLIGD